ncbi:MAG: efflux RND transporter periplasmic adaptor subunit [Firmicutes bacterium]|nr:efflux RND transporter periplasmic adaptor subunit [Bacillota bacterium]
MKRKIIKSALIIAVLAAMIGGGYYGYNHFNKTERPVMAEIAELTEQAEKNDLKETITASGTVYLADEQEIYAEGESNKIKRFLVDEGDEVKTGQLLVEYDIDDKKDDLERNIKESRLSIENSELSLRSIITPKTETELLQLKTSITESEKSLYEKERDLETYKTKLTTQQTAIDNAQKDVDKAQENITKAEKTLSDNSKLLEVGGISQSEYDDSIQAVKDAKDAYDTALSKYNDEVSALDELKTEEKQYEYAIQLAEANLESAQKKYEDSLDPLSDESTNIKYKQQQNSLTMDKNKLDEYENDLASLVSSTVSPVSGLVTEICVDEGTYTEENTVMLKIADFNKLIVKASIAEYDAPNIALGQSVEMTSDGLEGIVYNGKITKISPSASSTSTNMGSETVVPIEITVENPDGKLKPGYTLDLEILSVDKTGVLTVSSGAVLHDAEKDEYYVFKINSEKKAEKTKVEVGIQGEVYTEIISGLNETDEILKTADNSSEGKSIRELTEQTMAQNTSDKTEEKNSDSALNGILPSQNQGRGNRSGGGGMPGGMGGGPMGGR